MIQDKKFLSHKTVFNRELVKPGDVIVIYEHDEDNPDKVKSKRKGMVEKVDDSLITYQYRHPDAEERDGLDTGYLYLWDVIIDGKLSEAQKKSIEGELYTFEVLEV